MSDLERAYALVHSDPEHIEAALAAARREGAEEMRASFMEAFGLAQKHQCEAGYLRGAEEMRERAAMIAEMGCLVPPDGGSPTESEREMCDRIAAAIRALEVKRHD